MEGETGYFADGTRAFDTYDYDTEYLDNGVQYVITGNTKVSTYVCLYDYIRRKNILYQ